jgi:hypothetical protein
MAACATEPGLEVTRWPTCRDEQRAAKARRVPKAPAGPVVSAVRARVALGLCARAAGDLNRCGAEGFATVCLCTATWGEPWSPDGSVSLPAMRACQCASLGSSFEFTTRASLTLRTSGSSVDGIKSFTIDATSPIPTGTTQVRMEFDCDGGGMGEGGNVTLYCDGAQIGTSRVEQTQGFIFSADETTDIGGGTGTTVGAVLSEPGPAPRSRRRGHRGEAAFDPGALIN